MLRYNEQTDSELCAQVYSQIRSTSVFDRQSARETITVIARHLAATSDTEPTNVSPLSLSHSSPLAASLGRPGGTSTIILTMLIGVTTLEPPALGLGSSSALSAAEIGDADGRALVHLAGIVHDVVLASVEHDGVGEHAHDLALQLRRVDDAARRHQLLGGGQQQHAGGVVRAAAARQALVGRGGRRVDGAPARRDRRLDRLHVLRPPDHVAVAVGVAVAHRVAEQRRVLV